MRSCNSIRFKGKEGFYITNINIPLEMHMSFLSLRLHDDVCFLELWTHDVLIRGITFKSLTTSKIHHKDTGEHHLLEVNIHIYQMGFSLVLQKFLLISPLTTRHEVIAEQVIIVVKECFTKHGFQ